MAGARTCGLAAVVAVVACLTWIGLPGARAYASAIEDCPHHRVVKTRLPCHESPSETRPCRDVAFSSPDCGCDHSGRRSAVSRSRATLIESASLPALAIDRTLPHHGSRSSAPTRFLRPDPPPPRLV